MFLNELDLFDRISLGSRYQVLEFSDKEKYSLVVPAPGYSTEEIDIQVVDGVLEVSGKRKDKDAITRLVGSSFKVARLLPDDANSDTINASLDKGVLAVTVPKREKVVKKVSVLSGKEVPALKE